MTWEQAISVAALVLALAALVVGLIVLQRIRERGAKVDPLVSPAEPDRERASGPPAFVVNPIKTRDVDELRRLALEIAGELQLDEPLWFETTPEDPGVGQAREALAAGASVVVAAGGDGTVRAVATALAGTGTPMALLPMGTGNLLARNLDLPLDGTASLVRTALGGTDHPIDIGWIRPHRLSRAAGNDEDTAPESETDAAVGALTNAAGEHLFLVMAGIGFDAAMVAGADDELKSKMGWFAYFVAGARHLHGRKLRLRMRVGEGEVRPLKVRSLLLANCGRLPGGIVLLPDAELNDGWLDVAALDTRNGLLGWASLFGKVVLQGLGIRRDLPVSPSSIEFWRGREVAVSCDQPEHLQVDGDLIGEATAVTARLQAGGLRVRTR
ncbi:diacylglycerol/lipid kinase family protein [Ruania halotolerans]|uniref:diacylglycerol/lipid kinase family protein n=1 Tax=Ruania halotolerans TaxID=2897773 RepID=UPI001E643EFE|nr:diacylglycerol kinase family protein [Ruania halotolerans]UFU06951.1 diacylglycerol kinase [Ruania halotolerans]